MTNFKKPRSFQIHGSSTDGSTQTQTQKPAMKPRSSSSAKSHHKPGFTLVELMVTIVIVIALAALVFVATSRVKAASARAVSVDNLRKLQLANGLYASDNNSRFVACFTKNEDGKTGGLWDRNPEFLDYFIGVSQPTEGNSQESRVSPEHLDQVAYKARGNAHDTLKASYGMVSKESYTGSAPNTDSSYRLSELTTPSKTAAFVTAVNWLVQYSGRKGWNGVEGKVNAPRIAYRHRNKALVVYYDGHIGEVSEEDMAALDRRGGKNNCFWNGTNGQP